MRPYTTVTDLVAAGLVPPEQASIAEAAAQRHPVLIPPLLAAGLPQAGASLRRQVLPTAEELQDHPADLSDPIGDERHSPVKGIVHRYLDRVLLLPTMVCAVHCRFCFRRERVGEGILNAEELAAALAYIRSQPGVREVILSGGDPLVLSPRRLCEIRRELAMIPHVELLRLHSRLPLVAPERITTEMIAALSEEAATGPTLWLSLHVNHADELTPEVDAALMRLTAAGIPLLSQTVLLRGVNDDPAVLETLFRALLRRRVRPYYLHHPDLACGTSHFRLTVTEGQAIYAQLRQRMGRLGLPTYVLDRPGGDGKVSITPPE